MISPATQQESGVGLLNKQAPESNGSGKLSKTLANPKSALLAFFVSSILSIALLETCLTMGGIGEEEFLQRDPVMGWIHMPGKHVTWRKEGFSSSRINQAGMNDEEISITKAPGTLRIAVVGDSNVEAMQVPRHQSFCKRAEKALNETFGGKTKIEVLNFGVSAYNMGQVGLYLKNTVFKFQPDMVVVASDVDSIKKFGVPSQGFFSARPEFSLSKNNELEYDYTTQNKWLNSSEGKRVETLAWLRRYSHIWGVFGTIAEQVHNWSDSLKTGQNAWGANVTNKKTAFDGPKTDNYEYGINLWKTKSYPEKTDVLSQEEQAYMDKYSPLHMAILKDIKASCDKMRADMVVLRLPAISGHHNNPETAQIKTFCDGNNVVLIDPTQRFLKELDQSETALFYNPHMAPDGHKLLAEEMTAALAPMVGDKLQKQ